MMTLARIYAVLLGACIGSFLNVCVLRWPREQSIMRPRSRCPQCGYRLSWYDNIPMVSWLWLRGSCRCCGEHISAMYPLVEATTAFGWFLCVEYFGVTFLAFRVAIFGTLLLGVLLTDAREYLIPDGFTLTGLVFALVTAVADSIMRHGDTAGTFAAPYDALVGACAGAGMIAIVGWLGEIATKKEAMGFGDITLMAFVGAALGPARSFVTVFVGAALGAVTFLLVVIPAMSVRRKLRGAGPLQTELALGPAGGGKFELPLVPFGVFLAPAAVVTLLWGDVLLGWIGRT